MSTIRTKRRAPQARRGTDNAVRPLGLVAAGVAQAHGLFVLPGTLLGLMGFPRRSLPWLAAGWAALAALALSAASGGQMQTRVAPWRTISL